MTSLISSAVLWCVASTRTRPRNLITTTPSPSRTELRYLNCTYLWLHDRRANHLLGPPVIDAKAGAVSQWICIPPTPMSVVAGRTRRSFRSQHALPPARGGHAAFQSVSDGQKHTVVLMHCSSTPSLFDFPKRRRAKRSPDARVLVSCVE